MLCVQPYMSTRINGKCTKLVGIFHLPNANFTGLAKTLTYLSDKLRLIYIWATFRFSYSSCPRGRVYHLWVSRCPMRSRPLRSPWFLQRIWRSSCWPTYLSHRRHLKIRWKILKISWNFSLLILVLNIVQNTADLIKWPVELNTNVTPP